MQRKQIHQQIEIIVGKLYQLNKYLLTSEDMLEIEVDLIKTYMTELNRLTSLLNTENSTKETVEIVQPLVIIEKEDVQHSAETKQPELETTTEEEDIKFIKEEIIEPIIKEVEKEIKIAEAQVKEVVENIKADIGNKSLNELFSGSKLELVDKLLHHTTGKALKDFISISDKFMFISELFNKDLMAYESTIKKLNEVHSIEEAHRYIEQELNNRFDWSKKHDAVKHFQSILKKKFDVPDKN